MSVKLSFCQKDPPIRELFWQKDSLITRILFEPTSDALKFVPKFKMSIPGPFLVLFCRLHSYLSQKLGSDYHFEVSNMSKY